MSSIAIIYMHSYNSMGYKVGYFPQNIYIRLAIVLVLFFHLFLHIYGTYLTRNVYIARLLHESSLP